MLPRCVCVCVEGVCVLVATMRWDPERLPLALLTSREADVVSARGGIDTINGGGGNGTLATLVMIRFKCCSQIHSVVRGKVIHTHTLSLVHLPLLP